MCGLFYGFEAGNQNEIESTFGCEETYLGSSNAALLKFVGGGIFESNIGLVRVNETKRKQGWVELRRGNPVLKAMESETPARSPRCRPQMGSKFWEKIPLLKKLPLVKGIGCNRHIAPAQRNFLSRASFGTFSGPQSIGLHAVPAPGTAVISTGVERASKGSYGTGRATIRSAWVDGYKLGTSWVQDNVQSRQ
ncbi:hypothetical protein C8F04DRAFT_1189324 [Mycena alexandri]|uniref:Uncharacterized protein n=1 Tax=Mycena alexandri TaxID=1745969 RepID=A0AAD6X0D0_9AGAR|nr:hypothetical protein C8F04DRAFT_1189324 [Mycena alexandri]